MCAIYGHLLDTQRTSAVCPKVSDAAIVQPMRKQPWAFLNSCGALKASVERCGQEAWLKCLAPKCATLYRSLADPVVSRAEDPDDRFPYSPTQRDMQE